MSTEHCLQYAIVGARGVVVTGTENLSDAEVVGRTRTDIFQWNPRVERYDRCPACEAWTTSQGRLREDLNCPAVRAEIAKRADRPG